MARRRHPSGFDPEGTRAYPRKLRLVAPQVWGHHAGNWDLAIQLMEEKLHHPRGVLLVASVADLVDLGAPLARPWVGVVHQPWRHDRAWPDAERVLASDVWRTSRPFCRGLWTLARDLADTLRPRVPGILVDSVLHPARDPGGRFDPACLEGGDRTLLHVGGWLRDRQAFLDVEAPGYRKLLLAPRGPELDRLRGLAGVDHREHAPAPEYERLLARSVVFLNLGPVAASNTVLECLVRATPLVVNDRPALREYLGEDYPLFYRDLDEAARILADPGRLRAGHEFLRASPTRARIEPRGFLDELVATEVYRGLPDPEGAPRR